MANTYHQVYIQVVFATKGRETLIEDKNRQEIEKYITGILTNKGQKLIAIYANPDHLHLFFSYKNLKITIPELVKIIKSESTKFINDLLSFASLTLISCKLFRFKISTNFFVIKLGAPVSNKKRYFLSVIKIGIMFFPLVYSNFISV